MQELFHVATMNGREAWNEVVKLSQDSELLQSQRDDDDLECDFSKKGKKRHHDGEEKESSLVSDNHNNDAQKAKKNLAMNKNPASVAKRNARERRRIKNVNRAFDELRQHVPLGEQNKKISKVDTLQSAIEYIKALECLVKQKRGVDMFSDDKENVSTETTKNSEEASECTLQTCRTPSTSEFDYSGEYATVVPCNEKKLFSESQHYCLHDDGDNSLLGPIEQSAKVDVSDQCSNGNNTSRFQDDSGYFEKSQSFMQYETPNIWPNDSTTGDRSTIFSIPDRVPNPAVFSESTQDITTFMEKADVNMDFTKNAVVDSAFDGDTSRHLPLPSVRCEEFPQIDCQEVECYPPYCNSQPLCSTPGHSVGERELFYSAVESFSSDLQSGGRFKLYDAATY